MTPTLNPRRTAPTLRIVLAVAATLALAIAGTASASARTRAHITGGTSQLALSSAATNLLSTNHIAVTPLTPATTSGSTFSFPITRGRLNPATLHGRVVQAGGLSITNGTRTVRLRHLTLVAHGHTAALFAAVHRRIVRSCHRFARRHRGRRCLTVVRYRVARIAKVSGVTVSGTTASGTVRLTPFSARLFNALAGKQVAAAGAPIGTATVAPTLS